MVTLLQKFLQSDVIEDARGRDTNCFESGSHLYRFVKMPGPLNFLDDDVMCISNSYALAHPGKKRNWFQLIPILCYCGQLFQLASNATSRGNSMIIRSFSCRVEGDSGRAGAGVKSA